MSDKPETTIQIGLGTAAMVGLAILGGYAAVSFVFFQMTMSMIDSALVTNQRVNDLHARVEIQQDRVTAMLGNVERITETQRQDLERILEQADALNALQKQAAANAD